jgi:hypothetical protein
MEVVEFAVKATSTVLILTWVTFIKFVPLMTIVVVPVTGEEQGPQPVIVGGGGG